MTILKYTSTLLLFLCCSCNTEKTLNYQVVVSNPLPFDRKNETVEIDLRKWENSENKKFKITKQSSTNPIISQELDVDGDGRSDILLFQPNIKGGSSETFEIQLVNINDIKPSDTTCFSRFVPERTDDYAWENDKVAFRTFGPEAQRMKEANIPGGTLTSGIDAWLKRVDYPIIDKWYKKETSGAGSYHEDTGEGLDNFHVGISRGIGGSAVRHHNEYAVSKNFVTWKTHCVGPIRTSFTLTYDAWEAGKKTIKETKTITLDRGAHLSRFDCNVEGVDTISIGLTLHENDGLTDVNVDNGWATYWQPHGDSELGTALVIPDDAMANYEKHLSDVKDESNLYAHIKIEDNHISYYAGFGWQKSGQFSNQDEWNSYIKRFAQQLEKPLKIQYL